MFACVTNFAFLTTFSTYCSGILIPCLGSWIQIPRRLILSGVFERFTLGSTKVGYSQAMFYNLSLSVKRCNQIYMSAIRWGWIEMLNTLFRVVVMFFDDICCEFFRRVSLWVMGVAHPWMFNCFMGFLSPHFLFFCCRSISLTKKCESFLICKLYVLAVLFWKWSLHLLHWVYTKPDGIVAYIEWEIGRGFTGKIKVRMGLKSNGLSFQQTVHGAFSGWINV